MIKFPSTNKDFTCYYPPSGHITKDTTEQLSLKPFQSECATLVHFHMFSTNCSLLGLCLPVCGQMLKEGKQISHDDINWSGPGLDKFSHLHHKLMLGLQLCKRKVTGGVNDY